MTMEKELNEYEVNAATYRKQRRDKGGTHKPPVHGNKRVGQYNLAGHLEREYESLKEAVEQNGIGATYQGILFCCQGRIRKHCGKIWRFDQETEIDYDLSDLF